MPKKILIPNFYIAHQVSHFCISVIRTRIVLQKRASKKSVQKHYYIFLFCPFPAPHPRPPEQAELSITPALIQPECGKSHTPYPPLAVSTEEYSRSTTSQPSSNFTPLMTTRGCPPKPSLTKNAGVFFSGDCCCCKTPTFKRKTHARGYEYDPTNR